MVSVTEWTYLQMVSVAEWTYLQMVSEDCSQQAKQRVDRKQKSFFLAVNKHILVCINTPVLLAILSEPPDFPSPYVLDLHNPLRQTAKLLISSLTPRHHVFDGVPSVYVLLPPSTFNPISIIFMLRTVSKPGHHQYRQHSCLSYIISVQ